MHRSLSGCLHPPNYDFIGNLAKLQDQFVPVRNARFRPSRSLGTLRPMRASGGSAFMACAILEAAFCFASLPWHGSVTLELCRSVSLMRATCAWIHEETRHPKTCLARLGLQVGQRTQGFDVLCVGSHLKQSSDVTHPQHQWHIQSHTN